VARVERFVDQLEKEIHFGGREFALQVGQLEQVEMAAGLPEAQKGFEDLHARFVEALLVDHVVNFTFGVLEQLFVDHVLIAAECAVRDALDFFRQVFGHFFFEPAHEERVQLAAQFELREVGVGPALCDRQFVVLAERFVIAKVAGHQEIHD